MKTRAVGVTIFGVQEYEKGIGLAVVNLNVVD